MSEAHSKETKSRKLTALKAGGFGDRWTPLGSNIYYVTSLSLCTLILNIYLLWELNKLISIKCLTLWLAYNRYNIYNLPVTNKSILYNCSHLRSQQDYGFISSMPRKGKKGLRISNLELLSRHPTFICVASLTLRGSLLFSLGFCPSWSLFTCPKTDMWSK